jgi:hypothetical protein
MMAHCRQNHPEKPPFGGEPATELVVTNNEGGVMSWEEINQLLENPLFWYNPKGAVLPTVEMA